MKTRTIENKHCVIADQAHGRRWGSEADSIEHARDLLARSGTPDEFYVVKIVKIVRRVGQPTEVLTVK